jgi:nucleoside 2-deoxyribosyltransferase
MIKAYLSSSCRNLALNDEVEALIRTQGIDVLCPCKLTSQDSSLVHIFQRNIELIKSSDIIVAVLHLYGKDTTTEVGIGYGMGIPMIGIDFDGDPEDVMMYFALTRVVKIDEFAEALSELVSALPRKP